MIRRPPRSTLSSSSAASDVYKRQGVLGDGPRDRRLGGAEELAQLLLDVIAPQITQRHDHRFEQSKGLLTSESFGLRPKGLCNRRAQGDDLVLAETRSMIHVTACSLRV